MRNKLNCRTLVSCLRYLEDEGNLSETFVAGNIHYQIRCMGYQILCKTRWSTSAKGTKTNPTACDLTSTLTGDCLRRNACKGYAVCR
jgi:hypothetical protein